jgi:hypothetical protein
MSQPLTLNLEQFVEGRSWRHGDEEAWLKLTSLRALGSQTGRRTAAPQPDSTRYKV